MPERSPDVSCGKKNMKGNAIHPEVIVSGLVGIGMPSYHCKIE